MSSSQAGFASGTNVSIRYIREGIRGQVPVMTAIAAITTGTQSGSVQTLTRGAGSFITDGFTVGQRGTLAGAPDGDGTYRITNVTATVLTIDTGGATITNADAGNTFQLRMEKLRTTGRAFSLEKATLESAEVDPDGMESDVRHGLKTVSGTPGAQLSLGDYDDHIEFLQGGTFEEITATAPTSLAMSDAGVITGVGTTFLDDGFRPGDLVRTAGFDTATNNGDFFVTAVTSNTSMTLAPSSSSFSFETDGADVAATVVLPGSRCDMARDFCTAVYERAFADVPLYEPFLGCTINQGQVSISPEAIVTVSFTILGISANAMSGTPVSSLAPIDGPLNSPMSGFQGGLYEGGARIGGVTSMEFTVNRNRVGGSEIGSDITPDLFDGQVDIQGTASLYFANATMYNKFVNETESSIFLKVADPTLPTHFLTFVFHRVKYMGATIDPPQEGPIIVEMPFRALKKTGLNAVGASTTVNTSLTIQRSNDWS